MLLSLLGFGFFTPAEAKCATSFLVSAIQAVVKRQMNQTHSADGHSLQQKEIEWLKAWDDVVAPLFHSDHYDMRFESVQTKTAQLSEKYYQGHKFPLWQPHCSDAEIEYEFLVLTKLRTEAWFELTDEMRSNSNRFESARNWREDFRPAYSLFSTAFVRNLNCIAFDSNPP